MATHAISNYPCGLAGCETCAWLRREAVDAARSAADMDRIARADAERAEGIIAARSGYRLTVRDESTRSRAWLDGYYDCARDEGD